MLVQETSPGVFAEVTNVVQFPDRNGYPVSWSPTIADAWSDEQLAAINCYRVDPFVPPAGKIVTGTARYERQGDKVVQLYDVADAPPPETISDRQFFQALAMQGLITQAEALDAVKTGAIPAAMQSYIDALPDDQKFPAMMLLSGAVEFNRYHPLVEAFAAANGFTPQMTDDLWRLAASL